MRLFSRVLTVAIALGVAAPAMAGLVTYTDLTPGASTVVVASGGITTTVEAFSDFDKDKTGKFANKTVNGLTGTGVAGGPSGAEIDLKEAIAFTFSQALVLRSLEISFLFNAPDFNDRGKGAEKAKFLFFNGADLVLTTFLTVTSDSTADYSEGAPSSVVNLGSAQSGSGTGWWNILNPAGNLSVTKMVLRAADNGVKKSNSDYSFRSVSAVPEPSTFAMGALSLVFAGGHLLRRRWQGRTRPAA